MTPERSASGPGPTALPPDERLRQHGAKLVIAISATLRVGRAYNVHNQVFLHQLDSLIEAVKPALDEHGEAVLVAMDSDLYLNGVRIPVNASSFKFNQSVVDMLRRLRIAGVRFEPNVRSQDLGRMFELMIKQEGPTGSQLLEACRALAVAGAAPVVSATTEPMSEDEARAAAAREAAGEKPPAEDGAPASAPAEPLPPDFSEHAAKRRHSQALQGARILLMPTSLQTNLEVRHAKRVVQPLVEGVSLSEPVVVGLSSLTQHDEYTYAHAVNVCAIAVSMGHFLGLDRRALADLGVAALLHDVGKQAVGPHIAHDLEDFTPEECAAAERHPLEGARLLARSTTLNPTTYNCMRVALEHHVASHGGYPTLPAGWRPSPLSQIVAVADCFISLQSRLSRKSPGVSPTEALGMMLGPLAIRFEPALLWALVRSVGFYPAGQMVELEDGCIALVLAPNKQDPARPHVRVIVAPNGIVLPPEHRSEMRPLPEHRSVRRALRLAEYPRIEDASPPGGDATPGPESEAA